MKHLAAYAQLRDIGLDGEQAFEELYIRLARWTAEIAKAYGEGEAAANDQRIERCIALLGCMDRAIDLSHDYNIASAVLSLHHFAIGTMVKAKAERYGAPLETLPRIFLTLAEIFAAIHRGKSRQSPAA